MMMPNDPGTSGARADLSDDHGAKPSLDLLRSLTDRHVLHALMDHGRLTRAEIAALTGISKPTISESAKRLSAAGMLVDTGERTTGRGRSGSYFTLSPAVGVALVACIRPDGVSAEVVDAFGETRRDVFVELERDAGPDVAAHALASAADRALGDLGPARLAVVSAADPVDRSTGRLVHLPDTPFLLGELDPVAILGPRVTGTISVDNDVNWAARAEVSHDASTASFVYLHLGEGLGCAVVSDGEVTRGHHGLAGEIAHLVSAGPDNTAMPLVEVFARLGLHHPASTSIDVDALRDRRAEMQAEDITLLATVARAVASVVAAAVALTDPSEIVLGGSWGRDPDLLVELASSLRTHPRSVPLRTSRLPAHPDQAGARAHGIADLRLLIARLASGPPVQ